MNGLIPRAEEYRPLVALLESDDFEDAESLAKALLRQAFDSLLQRDWWLTVVDLDGVSIAYGLSASQSAAEKLEAGQGWRRMVIPVSSVVKHARRMDLLQEPPSIKEKPVKKARQ